MPQKVFIAGPSQARAADPVRMHVPSHIRCLPLMTRDPAKRIRAYEKCLPSPLARARQPGQFQELIPASGRTGSVQCPLENRSLGHSSSLVSFVARALSIGSFEDGKDQSGREVELPTPATVTYYWIKKKRKSTPEVVVGVWKLGKRSEFRMTAPPYRNPVCGENRPSLPTRG